MAETQQTGLQIIQPSEPHVGAILLADAGSNDVAEFFHAEHATVPQSYADALKLATIAAAAPDLLAGGTAQTEIIRLAQSILTSYLIPDGIDGAEAINQLLGLLDGPDQRAAKSLWETALAKAEG